MIGYFRKTFVRLEAVMVGTLKIILKKVLLEAGSVALIFLYLFFIFWIETFHNLGSYFPYLLIFLLPAFIVGWRSHRSVIQTLIRGGLPFVLAVVIFSIIVASSSGLMRFLGWIRDVGVFILLYAAAASLALYLGWFFTNRAGKMRKWGVSVVSLLSLSDIRSGIDRDYLTGIEVLKEGG